MADTCAGAGLSVCVHVQWSSPLQPLPKWDLSSVPARVYCFHGLYYKYAPTTSSLRAAGWNTLDGVPKSVLFSPPHYAWVARFCLSPLTSPVHVQWSPTVSVGYKHREETQGSNCPCQGTATCALVSLTGKVWLISLLCITGFAAPSAGGSAVLS